MSKHVGETLASFCVTRETSSLYYNTISIHKLNHFTIHLYCYWSTVLFSMYVSMTDLGGLLQKARIVVFKMKCKKMLELSESVSKKYFSSFRPSLACDAYRVMASIEMQQNAFIVFTD